MSAVLCRKRWQNILKKIIYTLLDIIIVYAYNTICVLNDDALVAQLDRAFGYGPKGWEFEPSLVH